MSATRTSRRLGQRTPCCIGRIVPPGASRISLEASPMHDLGRGRRIGPGLLAGGLFSMLTGVGMPLSAQAGSPFVTDDPEPVEYGHWEIIGFSLGTLVHGDSTGAL